MKEVQFMKGNLVDMLKRIVICPLRKYINDRLMPDTMCAWRSGIQSDRSARNLNFRWFSQPFYTFRPFSWNEKESPLILRSKYVKNIVTRRYSLHQRTIPNKQRKISSS